MTVKELIDNFIFECEYHIYSKDDDLEDIFSYKEICENDWLDKKVVRWQMDNGSNSLWIDI